MKKTTKTTKTASRRQVSHRAHAAQLAQAVSTDRSGKQSAARQALANTIQTADMFAAMGLTCDGEQTIEDKVKAFAADPNSPEDKIQQLADAPQGTTGPKQLVQNWCTILGIPVPKGVDSLPASHSPIPADDVDEENLDNLAIDPESADLGEADEMNGDDDDDDPSDDTQPDSDQMTTDDKPVPVVAKDSDSDAE